MLFSNSPQLLSHNGAATIFSNCDCQNIHCATLPHYTTLCHHRAEAPPQLRKKPAVSLYLLLRPSPSGKHGDMRHATCGPVSRITISGPAASRRHVAVSPCRHVNIADWWPTAHWENLGHKEGIFYCLMCLLSMMQHTIIHLCMMALFSSDFNHIFSDRLHAFRWCSGTHLGQAAAASRIQI